MREITIRGHDLTVNELDDVYDPVTGHALTGSWVWNSSLVLSEWIVNQSLVEVFDIQGKTVLELGAGMGIPGLVSARLGAGRVILTDVAPLLHGLQQNVDLNGLADRVEVRELAWGSDESSGEFGEVDLVLMSDVFYDESEMKSLAKTLKNVCGSKTKIWAASEIRPSTSDCLNELVVSHGFEVTELMSQLGTTATDDQSLLYVVLNLVPRWVQSM
ncbi:Eef1a lysine methyltransferase [Thalictrum thalictroides]|uniref:Eef1a lysine methyltransferase n=1 Tax=Thalictrum thalictroides TaxID=46969 RepID=A0A7J6V0T1_THATH|nr:Eef1a lysine methyltransferase [Thalictrum thalictroides]